MVETEAIINLAFAAFLGLAIGIEREMKRKPAGIKTYVVISTVACLLSMLSIEIAYEYSKAYSRPMDPGRIPSYIISGIGFLGAGVILRRKNDVISGLTTAALVWGAAGIGIAVGVGHQKEALFGTAFILISVKFFPFILKFLGPKILREKEVRLRLFIKENPPMTPILKTIKQKKMSIQKVKVKDLGEEKQLDVVVMTDEDRYVTDIYEEIKKIKHVIKVQVEEL